MEWLCNPQVYPSLPALALLESVPGIDNTSFLSALGALSVFLVAMVFAAPAEGVRIRVPGKAARRLERHQPTR